MLRVTPQAEPAVFDVKVRQKGLAHLAAKNIDITQPLPAKTEITNYWVDCLDELYNSYNGVCAYIAVHFERVTGNGSVDHFAAKSSRADLAYEWSNYRLSCSRMNSRKNKYDDVLDPFVVNDGDFHLELVSGRIYANPQLPRPRFDDVAATITRLKLDAPDCRALRAKHFDEYMSGDFSLRYLKRISPLVWYEANRQGLL
ncbi:hypothetical protein JGC56_18215 [Salmonella enterica subsp. enterica serovar Saintpaul]|nr:hypothetical protein [Salmonella enterica subsp. enterica serovar Saintpaul]